MVGAQTDAFRILVAAICVLNVVAMILWSTMLCVRISEMHSLIDAQGRYTRSPYLYFYASTRRTSKTWLCKRAMYMLSRVELT